MMVASSADTIQTGVAALLKPITTRTLEAISPGSTGTEQQPSRLLIGINFLFALILVNIPAMILAMAQISVLSLFVAADLVCATAVVPVLLGLSPRIHPVAAGAGCLTGLVVALAIFGVGVNNENFNAKTNTTMPMMKLLAPDGLYSQTSLLAFIIVPLCSGVTCLLVNIPYHMQSYRFGGFQTSDEATTTASKGNGTNDDNAKEVVDDAVSAQ